MSKIARYAGNMRAFASEAQGLERTLFGETRQADDLTAQVTAAFLRGWGIVGPSEHPSLEDFNAAMYAMSQFIAYQHQMGAAEWHAEQEYYVGSICIHGGESYQSLENANVGNEPPSAQWTPVLTSKNGFENLGLGTAATREVGAGVDQIPDMSNWTSGAGWRRTPDGFIEVWGESATANSSTGIAIATFPIPFPNQCLSVVINEVTNVSSGASGVKAWGLCKDTISKNGVSAILNVTGGPAVGEFFSFRALGR